MKAIKKLLVVILLCLFASFGLAGCELGANINAGNNSGITGENSGENGGENSGENGGENSGENSGEYWHYVDGVVTKWE